MSRECFILFALCYTTTNIKEIWKEIFILQKKNTDKQRRNCVSDVATGDFFLWWEQGSKSDKVLNKILPERWWDSHASLSLACTRSPLLTNPLGLSKRVIIISFLGVGWFLVLYTEEQNRVWRQKRLETGIGELAYIQLHNSGLETWAKYIFSFWLCRPNRFPHYPLYPQGISEAKERSERKPYQCQLKSQVLFQMDSLGGQEKVGTQCIWYQRWKKQKHVQGQFHGSRSLIQWVKHLRGDWKAVSHQRQWVVPKSASPRNEDGHRPENFRLYVGIFWMVGWWFLRAMGNVGLERWLSS